MKVTQKKIDGGKLELQCVASDEDVQKALYSAALDFASQMGLKPDKTKTVEAAIQEKLGIKDVDAMVQGRAIELLVPMALNKKDIAPLYPPEPMPTSEFKRGRSFSFTLRVSPKPYYELTSYDPIDLEVEPFIPDYSSVDEQLAQMTEQYATFRTAPNKTVEKGDTCLISIDASVNGEPLKNLSNTSRPYVTGEGYMPDGFDNAVIGMNPGETKTFQFEAPSWDDQGNDVYEMVDCTVTVLEIQEPVKAEMTDEWVATHMPMYRSVADMRSSLEKQVEKLQRKQYDMVLRNQASNEIAKRFQGKIEDAAYESASKQLMERMRAEVASKNMTWDQFVEENGGQQQFQMFMMLQTRQQLITGFALDSVFRKKKLVVTEEDITDACMMFNPQSPSRIRKELEESGRGFVVREAAERMCAAKYLVAHANIKEVAPKSAPEA